MIRIGPPPPRRRLPPWVVANTAAFWRAHLAADAESAAAGPRWPSSVDELLHPPGRNTEPRDVVLAREVAHDAAFLLGWILR